MTFYSIKYVETKGIEEWEGEMYELDTKYATTTQDSAGGLWNSRFELIDQDCFETRSAALAAGRSKLLKTLKGIDKRRARVLQLIGELV